MSCVSHSLIVSVGFAALLEFSGVVAAGRSGVVGEQDEGLPLTARIEVVSSSSTVDTEFELQLKLTITNTWHVYGHTGGDDGQRPMKLELHLPAGLEPAGEWVWPNAETTFSNRLIEYYTGNPVFRRKVRIKSRLTKPSKIAVTISYQACTSSLCLPPDTLNVSVTLPGLKQ